MFHQKVAMILFSICWCASLIPFFGFYFTNAFERYNVYENFTDNYTTAFVNAKFEEVLATARNPFGESAATKLDFRFFSAEDILHMVDVQNLYKAMWILVIVSIFVIGWSTRRILAKDKSGSASAEQSNSKNSPRSIFLLIGFTALVLFAWEKVFTFVHKLLFPFNNYWELDPATSNLIKYLPSQVFQELFVILVISSILAFVLVHKVNAKLFRGKKSSN